MKAHFLPAAEAELLKQVAYYSIAREGFGVKFRAAIMLAVEMAAANPESGAASHKGTRRRIVKGFPFSVVYRPSDTELLIVAIAPNRRKPQILGRSPCLTANP
ncbi:MAG: type II toxin-antitoxin system RelE/ParE family toxin [Burkholderiales bacterium]